MPGDAEGARKSGIRQPERCHEIVLEHFAPSRTITETSVVEDPLIVRESCAVCVAQADATQFAFSPCAREPSFAFHTDSERMISAADIPDPATSRIDTS